MCVYIFDETLIWSIDTKKVASNFSIVANKWFDTFNNDHSKTLLNAKKSEQQQQKIGFVIRTAENSERISIVNVKCRYRCTSQ